jgi:hypothetical protein
MDITSKKWLSAVSAILPPAPHVHVPEDGETVVLKDAEQNFGSGGGARQRDAYEEDEEEHQSGGGGGPGVQCAHQ